MDAHKDSDSEPPAGAFGRLESIQISNGGVPKHRVDGPVAIGTGGLAGDRQRDLRFHGGPDRAVCLFSSEIIRQLRDQGHPIDHGTTGENLTISGLEWGLVSPGARVRVGDALLEITRPAHPCKNIADSFADRDFSRISAKLHPGVGRMYARVLEPGVVRSGDPVVLSPSR